MTRARWHKWFAWHPVWIGGACIWLKRIERRRRIGYDMDIYGMPYTVGYWEYRAGG